MPAGEELQVGFAVSVRNFPKAVDRNRIKRIGREAWRIQSKGLPACKIAVFLLYTSKEIIPFLKVKEAIELISAKLVEINIGLTKEM